MTFQLVKYFRGASCLWLYGPANILTLVSPTMQHSLGDLKYDHRVVVSRCFRLLDGRFKCCLIYFPYLYSVFQDLQLWLFGLECQLDISVYLYALDYGL